MKGSMTGENVHSAFKMIFCYNSFNNMATVGARPCSGGGPGWPAGSGLFHQEAALWLMVLGGDRLGAQLLPGSCLQALRRPRSLARGRLVQARLRAVVGDRDEGPKL